MHKSSLSEDEMSFTFYKKILYPRKIFFASPVYVVFCLLEYFTAGQIQFKVEVTFLYLETTIFRLSESLNLSISHIFDGFSASFLSEVRWRNRAPNKCSKKGERLWHELDRQLSDYRKRPTRIIERETRYVSLSIVRLMVQRKPGKMPRCHATSYFTLASSHTLD